jgi:predicted nucleic-acid-binding Zn-ribbon protein
MSDDAAIPCEKCGTTMEEGFILDTGLGHATAGTWVEGELGSRPWAVKLEGRQRFAIATYRCPKCGYLESYARLPE